MLCHGKQILHLETTYLGSPEARLRGARCLNVMSQAYGCRDASSATFVPAKMCDSINDIAEQCFINLCSAVVVTAETNARKPRVAVLWRVRKMKRDWSIGGMSGRGHLSFWLTSIFYQTKLG